MKAKAKSQRFLKKHVLEESLCTGCGACVGLCPYQVIYHDRTVQLHNCDLEDGRCYVYCPRTLTDLVTLRAKLFNPVDLTPEIGPVKGYYVARAVDAELRAAAQHGGTVTALMALALAEGLIDSALVSSSNSDFEQEGAMISDKKDLLQNTRSKFTVSPTIAAFHKLVTKDRSRIGIVATPCQALSLAKMKTKPAKEDFDKVNQLQLVIGLYCGWTLSIEKYSKMLSENNISRETVRGLDIPAGKNILEIFTNQGVKHIPFHEVEACIRPACKYCLDSTAEYADLSVGSARFSGDWEEVRKWNQLIVRTDKGQALVDLAVKKGVLEIREAPVESLNELKEAAVRKKKQALKNIVQKTGSIKNLLYLDSRDPVVKKYLGAKRKNE